MLLPVLLLLRREKWREPTGTLLLLLLPNPVLMRERGWGSLLLPALLAVLLLPLPNPALMRGRGSLLLPAPLTLLLLPPLLLPLLPPPTLLPLPLAPLCTSPLGLQVPNAARARAGPVSLRLGDPDVPEGAVLTPGGEAPGVATTCWMLLLAVRVPAEGVAPDGGADLPPSPPIDLPELSWSWHLGPCLSL